MKQKTLLEQPFAIQVRDKSMAMNHESSGLQEHANDPWKRNYERFTFRLDL